MTEIDVMIKNVHKDDRKKILQSLDKTLSKQGLLRQRKSAFDWWWVYTDKPIGVKT